MVTPVAAPTFEEIYSAATAINPGILTRNEYKRYSAKEAYKDYKNYEDYVFKTWENMGRPGAPKEEEETPPVTRTYPVETVSPAPVPTVDSNSTPTVEEGKTGEGGDGGGDTGEEVVTGGPKDEELAKLLAKIEALEKLLGGFKTGSGYSSRGNAQAAYDAQLKAIEEQRLYAEKLAEQARQEAIKNAYINYDRSLSTYGQNAERLAQMGLTNSGYSDYLGGVAYSSMVGGVQDAHKTANEAIERAYYNASQQKAEAADTLYNRQLQEEQIRAAERAEQAQLLASVYSAVSNGDMSSEVANIILQTYGIGSTANGGNVDNTGNGGTPADTDIPDNTDIPDTIKKAAEEQAYENYISQITSSTLDSEIEAFDVSLETKKKFKDHRDELAVEEAKENIKAGVFKQDLDLGVSHLGKEAQQEIYFENALAVIENSSTDADKIDSVIRYINYLGDKLTTSDKQNLIDYANRRKVFIIPENSYEYKYDNSDGWLIIFGGTEKRFNYGFAPKKITEEISKYIPNAKSGDIVRYNGKIYVYNDAASRWYKVSGLDEYFKEIETLKPPTKPEHTPESKEQ